MEASRLLGVRRETLYAYVSRGLLTRHPGADPRTSLYDRAEVARLAERSPRTGRTGVLDVIVDSQITLLDPDGRFAYRGLDAVGLARSRSFEAVAELLWGGGEPPRRSAGAGPAPWSAGATVLEAGRRVAAALGVGAAPVDRMRMVVAALPATDALRSDLRETAVRERGRILIAALVDSLPRLSAPRDASIAARLWSCLSPRRPLPRQLALLDDALVLLADHELAVSTLGARVAASAHADPYLVVLAGLSVLGGGLHGAHSTAAAGLLAAISTEASAPAIVGRALATGGSVPGFGHAVYRDRDPRADALLERLAAAAPAPDRLSVVRAVIELVGRHDGPAPNVDFALAALADVWGLVPGSTEAIFATARSAGWIAHAIEEYPHRLRFRGRAAYVGPSLDEA
jgi:citrate synthase